VVQDCRDPGIPIAAKTAFIRIILLRRSRRTGLKRLTRPPASDCKGGEEEKIRILIKRSILKTLQRLEDIFDEIKGRKEAKSVSVGKKNRKLIALETTMRNTTDSWAGREKVTRRKRRSGSSYMRSLLSQTPSQIWGERRLRAYARPSEEERRRKEHLACLLAKGRIPINL